MLICKGDKSYKCSELRESSVGNTRKIRFSITDSVSPAEVKELFVDTTFYFYDELLKDKLTLSNNTTLVALSIQYNADSNCKITIKLKKGVVDNES